MAGPVSLGVARSGTNEVFHVFGSINLSGVSGVLGGLSSVSAALGRLKAPFAAAAATGTALTSVYTRLAASSNPVVQSLGSVVQGMKPAAQAFAFGATAVAQYVDMLTKFTKVYATVPTIIAAATAKIEIEFAKLGKSWADVYSTFIEGANVIQATFGTEAQEGWIKTWLESTAGTLGLSDVTAQNYLGTVGSVLKGVGVEQDFGTAAFEEMSRTVVQMTSDFASFRDLSFEETWDKLMSGLRGQTNAIEALGISGLKRNVEDYIADAEALAAETGLFGSDWKWQSASGSEQFMAMYQYIKSRYEEMGVMGDFAKTLEQSMANNQRAIGEYVIQAQKSLGSVFYPMFLDVMNGARGLLEGFTTDLRGAEGDVDKMGEVISNWIPKAAEWAGQAVPTFIESMSGLFVKALDAVQGHPEIGTSVANIIGSALKAVSIGAEALGGLALNIARGLGEQIATHKDDIQKFMADTWEGLGSILGSLLMNDADASMEELVTFMADKAIALLDSEFAGRMTDAMVEIGLAIGEGFATSLVNTVGTAMDALFGMDAGRNPFNGQELSGDTFDGSTSDGNGGRYSWGWYDEMMNQPDPYSTYSGKTPEDWQWALMTKATEVNAAKYDEYAAALIEGFEYAISGADVSKISDALASVLTPAEQRAFMEATKNMSAGETEAYAREMLASLYANAFRGVDWQGLGIEGISSSLDAMNEFMTGFYLEFPNYDRAKVEAKSYEAGEISFEELQQTLTFLNLDPPDWDSAQVITDAYQNGQMSFDEMQRIFYVMRLMPPEVDQGTLIAEMMANGTLSYATMQQALQLLRLAPPDIDVNKVIQIAAARGGDFLSALRDTISGSSVNATVTAYTWIEWQILNPSPSLRTSGVGNQVAWAAQGGVWANGIRALASGGALTTAGTVLRQATVLGQSMGRALVAGEAGPEAVAPVSVLQKYIADAVGAQTGDFGTVAAILERIYRDMPREVRLSTGQLVGALTPQMQRELSLNAARGVV